MTKIVRMNRVNPVNLFDEFDRMFERPLARPTMSANTWNVAVDVLENEDAYVVKASIPGVSSDNIELTLEDNVLFLKGEIKADETVENEKYHLRERRFGTFSCSIRFPVAVNSNAVEATYENGILTLNVPKAEEVKPKRIEIKTS